MEAERRPRRTSLVTPDVAFPNEGVDLERLVEDFEYEWVARALSAADGIKTRAAELLGLTFRQFRYKLSKYERRRQNG